MWPCATTDTAHAQRSYLTVALNGNLGQHLWCLVNLEHETIKKINDALLMKKLED